MKFKLLALSLLLCGLFVTQPAEAWVQTKTTQGKLLHWKKNNIGFRIHPEVPPGLVAGDVYYSIRQSFFVWPRQDCTCVKFQDNGMTDSRELGYDVSNPSSNINIVLFQQSSWNHDSRAVAITSNVFNEETGEVVAFDMELNAVNFTFSVDGQPRNGKATMDIRNVATHEVGHVIGLDHSPERESTMFASGLPGETKKRTLHSDDISGLCALYPTNGCTETTNPTTPPPTDGGCGCSQQPGDSTDLTPVFFLALFGVLFFGIRRALL